MECRCEELEKCRDDKRILATALNETVSIIAQDNLLQNQLQGLMNNSPDAYTTENIGEICTAIDKLNNDIYPAASGLISEISAKQEELEAMIAKFEKEDDEFHAAEGTAAS